MLSTLFLQQEQRLTPYQFFTHRFKMPFKSQSQRKWMYANDPKMAEKWEEHTPKGKKLPKKVKKKSGKNKG
jgi:hypothetical protein